MEQIIPRGVNVSIFIHRPNVTYLKFIQCFRRMTHVPVCWRYPVPPQRARDVERAADVVIRLEYDDNSYEVSREHQTHRQ